MTTPPNPASPTAPAATRRLARHCLTALSLLLCVATTALWARSLTIADQLTYSHPTTTAGRYARTDWSILSGPGFLVIAKIQVIPADDTSAQWLQNIDNQTGYGWSYAVVDSHPLEWKTFTHGFQRIGWFSESRTRTPTSRHTTSVEIPHWLILAIASLPTLTPLARRLRPRKSQIRPGFPPKF